MRTRVSGWVLVILGISLVEPVSGQFRRPLQYRGLVMLEDGSPAPANVVLERVCNANVQAVAYADPGGAFSFEVSDSNQGAVSDASYPGTDRQIRVNAASGGDSTSTASGAWASSAPSMIGCDLRASLSGFRANPVRLYGYGPLETDIDLGTIILHKLAEVRGYTVSVTTAQAPKRARKAYENGLKHAHNGKWNRAEMQLRRAVKEYPGYAVAWQALGEVLDAQQHPAEARKAYDRAVEADSSYLSPYLLISLLAARERNWQEMEAASDHVVRLNPIDFPEAYYFLSVARANLNDLAGAESAAREAIARGAQERYPQAESVLGLVLAAQGKFGEASEHFNVYLDLNPDGEDVEEIHDRLAEVNAQIAAQSQP